MDITEFGWSKKGGEKEGAEVIMPILDASPVAPPALLDMISCNCKAGLKPCLTAKCSCLAAGLACTNYCFCKGSDITCCNSLTLSQQEEQDETNADSEDEDNEEEFDDDMLNA